MLGHPNIPIFKKKKHILIELDDGKIYRKTLYLMVKTMVSCKFSLNQSSDIPLHGKRCAPAVGL